MCTYSWNGYRSDDEESGEEMLDMVDEALSDDADGEENPLGATLLASNAADGKKGRDRAQQQSSVKNSKVGERYECTVI